MTWDCRCHSADASRQRSYFWKCYAALHGNIKRDIPLLSLTPGGLSERLPRPPSVMGGLFFITGQQVPSIAKVERRTEAVTVPERITRGYSFPGQSEMLSEMVSTKEMKPPPVDAAGGYTVRDRWRSFSPETFWSLDSFIQDAETGKGSTIPGQGRALKGNAFIKGCPCRYGLEMQYLRG